MAGIGGWLGQRLSSTFIASALKCSCIVLPEVDTDSDSEHAQPLLPAKKSSKPTATQGQKIGVKGFHHVEFYCSDATEAYESFSSALGMDLVAKSDRTTSNQTYRSYAIQSNEVTFVFTSHSPQSDETRKMPQMDETRKMPHPGFLPDESRRFVAARGLAMKALGFLVDDVRVAFERSVASGAIPAFKPTVLVDEKTFGKVSIAEVRLCGEIIIRYVSKHDFQGPFLPNYEPVRPPPLSPCRLLRLEHVLFHIHEHEGISEEAQCPERKKGSKSIVVGIENKKLLISRLKSECCPVEHIEDSGSGIQCLAVVSDDIFKTVEEIVYSKFQREQTGSALEVMGKPSSSYYQQLKAGRIASMLTDDQLAKCEELGIMVDRDEQGLRFHILTRPLGKRSTICFDIIQRV